MGDQGETENGSEVGSLKTNSLPARAIIAWSTRGDGPSTPIVEFFNPFSKADEHLTGEILLIPRKSRSGKSHRHR